MLGIFTSSDSSAIEDSEVGYQAHPERTGFNRVKVRIGHTSGRLAGQPGCVKVVNRMRVRVEQIKTL